ncbi:Putative Prohibitin-1 [Rhizopus microsporus]|nr:Putative Prohibitin-1 [Rhizopus microsporus]
MAAILEKIAKLAIPAGLVVGGIQSSMYDVQGGYRAVIFDRIQGVKPTSVGEGTHFLVPWLQRAVLFDTHMTFGKEFTNAVEQKQIAQQEAERAKFVVERAEQEKQAAIIRAEGSNLLLNVGNA